MSSVFIKGIVSRDRAELLMSPVDSSEVFSTGIPSSYLFLFKKAIPNRQDLKISGNNTLPGDGQLSYQNLLKFEHENVAKN